MLRSTGATYTRVAVVQLAYHPAALVDRRSPLEDPLFDPRGGPDPLLPRGEVPDAIAAELAALRTRIRNAHNDQLLAKLRAVLAACQAWGVRIVVLPEYSVPWEILGGVADAAGEMVVVAGTHAVDRDARRSGVYERLVAPAVPAFGQAVCPVLHRGRILAIQPKLHPAVPERGSMKPGESWVPIAMPDGIVGPLGILVCLDFLYRESEAHTKLVAGPLGQCRFLAVPSLTPHYTLPEFAGKAWEEARRYGRPVLYCDGAEGGGTAIYVDEGQPYELRRFPDRSGYLEPGDEGVIVADVNLGYERPGGSTRYEAPRPVVPVAEATLVYTAHPAGKAYAAWLEEAGELLAREDDEAVEALDARVRGGREVLLNAGALTGAAARGRRMKRLVAEIGKVTSVEEIRRFTREVVLPEGALPLGEVRRAMAAGAADAMFDWMKRRDVRASGFGEVEGRLREAAAKRAEWVGEAAGKIAWAVRGIVEGEERAPAVEVPVRILLPSGVDPAALGRREHGGWVLEFRATPAHLQAVLRPSVELDRNLLRAADDMYDLAVAKGADRVAVVAAWRADWPLCAIVMVASAYSNKWVVHHVGSTDTIEISDAEMAASAMTAVGLADTIVNELWYTKVDVDVAALAPVVEGAPAVVRSLRDQRLREVNGAFVEPYATVASGAPKPAFGALDAWLDSREQTALVLGEFGAGKSTLLAEWALRRWEQRRKPLPILVSLAGAGSSASPEALLLQAAGLDDAPKHRAALRLLIRGRHIVPCFDGFDEMATRMVASELAGRLSALLEVAATSDRGAFLLTPVGGKVLISSRTNYFPNKEHLRTTADAALAQTLGASAGLRRIELLPFSDEQVDALVRKIRTEEGAADKALDRIAHIYDLHDLVHRPLLLGMVLNTLDSLDTGQRVGRADLYDAYLARWLDQTRKEDPECFTDEEKMTFAEALAEELWRSGQPGCTWQELQKSVRMRLLPGLREGLPVGAALLEMQGGAFFVHEGEDRYRFAHKSFLEYFFARALVATVAERPAEVLATKPITPEVAGFVGEILWRTGDPHEARAVLGVAAWLTGGRRSEGGSKASPDATAGAAANALWLLLGLARWAGDGRAWIPESADFRAVVLVKEDLRRTALVRADLAGADLSGANLSEGDLSGANLVGAKCVAVILTRTKLAGVNASEADFTLAEAEGADMSDAVLTGAVLRQSMWTGCGWHGVKAEGADVTAWAAPGAEGAFWRDAPLTALSPTLSAALAAGHIGVHTIAWSPDGTRLASGGDDRTVGLWDATAGTELARLEGHIAAVNAVAWSPDGTRLVSGGDDETVRLWDAAAGTELARLEGHAALVNTVAWSPDGTRLVSGGYDQTVRLWDAAAGTELARLEGHAALVNTVAWSPDGTRLVSGGSDRTVWLWDAAAGTEIARLEGHTASVNAVAWSPDGTRLVSGGDDETIRLWDATADIELARLEGQTARVSAVAWSPDGTRLVSGGDDNTVRLWDAAAGIELARLEGHTESVNAVAWSPNGTRLVSGGDDKTIRLWDATAGAEIARLEGHTILVNTVAWSPDGTRLACGGYDQTVRLWDAAAGTELARLEGHTASVSAVAWSPDGTRLVSGGYDQTVRLWDVAAGTELARLEGHTILVHTVAWSPDGTRLVSGGSDRTVCLWDAAAGTELARLEGHTNWVKAVAWSPDGTYLASGGYDNTVRLWDAVAGTELACLEGHTAVVNAVAWSPDGTRLVSGGDDKTVRVWDVGAGSELARFEGHIDRVNAVAWSSDGTRLVSGGDDKTVRLWDAAAGTELARVEGHTAVVNAVAWSPDGARLVSGGYDNTVRLWDANSLTLLGVFEMAGASTLTRTPGGFCIFDDTPSTPARLALGRPEPGSRTVLYLPLAGLRRVLHRPDKVRAALSGDLSGDDIRPELERLGWTNGVPWDGKAHRIPRTPPKEGAAAPDLAALGLVKDDAALENPFSPGPALTGELPPGREPTIKEILALLRKKRPAPAILRGPRRSGKTSLLHHLRDRLSKTHQVRFVTLEGRTAPLVTAHDLARVLDPSVASRPLAADTLRKRLQRQLAKRSVLLIDEVANLSSADASLFAWLRAVGQEGTGVLLAGSHWDWVRVVERAASIMPGSSFGNDVTPVTLGPLREADALRFLVDAAPPDVPLARDGTAKWILDLCGPWPFYLQVMGFSIVQAVREGERKALVEPVGVHDLYDQRLLLDRSAGYFATRWAELPDRAQRVLETIRDLPPGELPRARDLPPEDLGVLQETGLCNELDHWLPDKPFYDWIRRIHRSRR